MRTHAHTHSCPSCAADRELLKNFTRAEIRDRILRKLGMAHAPNVSTEAVPMRLVRQLLSRYRHHLADRDRERGMQGDQPHQHESDDGDDDFHFQTRQINIIAQDGESKHIQTIYSNCSSPPPEGLFGLYTAILLRNVPKCIVGTLYIRQY